jgi:hypothetical protein
MNPLPMAGSRALVQMTGAEHHKKRIHHIHSIEEVP